MLSKLGELSAFAASPEPVFTYQSDQHDAECFLRSVAAVVPSRERELAGDASQKTHCTRPPTDPDAMGI
jgi:hypothetical protein